MSIEKIKREFVKAYLEPQEKKWKRGLDASAAILCFISALVALYILNTIPGGKLPAVSHLVAWSFLVTSLPLANILYKRVELLKYERFIIVIFVLSSSISLLFSIMAAYTKT